MKLSDFMKSFVYTCKLEIPVIKQASEAVPFVDGGTARLLGYFPISRDHQRYMKELLSFLKQKDAIKFGAVTSDGCGYAAIKPGHNFAMFSPVNTDMLPKDEPIYFNGEIVRPADLSCYSPSGILLQHIRPSGHLINIADDYVGHLSAFAELPAPALPTLVGQV